MSRLVTLWEHKLIPRRVNRMYPIVPPPADVSADVNLDVSHHELLELEVAPDVLILPSRLKYFAKVRPVLPAPPCPASNPD